MPQHLHIGRLQEFPEWQNKQVWRTNQVLWSFEVQADSRNYGQCYLLQPDSNKLLRFRLHPKISLSRSIPALFVYKHKKQYATNLPGITLDMPFSVLI